MQHKIFALLVPLLAACGGGTETTDNCPREAVAFFVVGQSNAANYAQYEPTSAKVYDYHDGRCTLSTGKLKGSDGPYNNAFHELAATYANKTGQNVVLSSYAVGGIKIANMDLPLMKARHDALNARYAIRATLWQHGESDARDATLANDYAKRFDEITGTLGTKAIMATSTKCGNLSSLDNPIALYQIGVGGPQTNAISGRYDDCHYSAVGVREFIALWEPYIER